MTEKQEKFLNQVNDIDKKSKIYHSNALSKKGFVKEFNRFLIVKEKYFIKVFSVFLKKIFNFNFKKKINLFWGREVVVYLADNSASALYFFNSLYEHELRIIKFLIKNFKENDIFYDVGANYSFYTLLAQEFLNNGEIHSFEPNPDVFPLLKQNSKTDQYKNTFLNNAALSEINGEINFYNAFDYQHSGGSSLIMVNNSKILKIKVKSINLDIYVKNHKPPTIMKIDIEGGEPFALKGGLNTLKEFKPLIIMEYGSDDYHIEAFEILLNLGYQSYFLSKNGDLIKMSQDEMSKYLSKNFLNSNFEPNLVFKYEN